MSEGEMVYIRWKPYLPEQTILQPGMLVRDNSGHIFIVGTVKFEGDWQYPEYVGCSDGCCDSCDGGTFHPTEYAAFASIAFQNALEFERRFS